MKRKALRTELFRFSTLRGDWYRSNQALPRAIRQTIDGTRRFIFNGFPRQWIPLFVWFGVPWKNSVAPSDYLPFFSDLSEQELEEILKSARHEKMLRPLLEAASTLDPVISDCLYILDHSVKGSSDEMKSETAVGRARPRKTLLLTSWQSYGRPSVLRLEEEVARIPARGNTAVMLPCSFKRPYNGSPTHRRIYSRLKESGYDVENLHKIVVTSLGIIPEELWSSPAVVRYDAGVPDIYRLLRLLRTFFATRRYRYVVDCLEFQPYSDLLQIVKREGLITDLRRLGSPRGRAFYIRQPRSTLKPK